MNNATPSKSDIIFKGQQQLSRRVLLGGMVNLAMVSIIGCGEYKSNENQMDLSEGKTIPRKLHGRIVEGNSEIFAYSLIYGEKKLPWVKNQKNGNKMLTIDTAEGTYEIEKITGGDPIFTIARSGSSDDFWYKYDVINSKVQSDKEFSLREFNQHLWAVEKVIGQ